MKQVQDILSKYPNTRSLIQIDEFDDTIILKGYLLSKKVRILVLFQYVNNIFIPISLVKKESKKWNNITKQNYIDFFENDIDKAIVDIDTKDYKEVEL